MALSRTDKKLLAIGGGMFAGGKVVDKVGGGAAVETGAQATSMGGLTTLGFVGAGELVETVGQGHKAFASYHAKGIFNAIRGMGTRSQDMIQKDIAVAERIVKAGMRGIL